MIRKLEVYFLAVLTALIVAGCDDDSPDPVQAKEEQRQQDQKERLALVEKMKAAALVEEKKKEPIRDLQKKIDALDDQIGYARARGKDGRALEQMQEAVEAQKYELTHQ